MAVVTIGNSAEAILRCAKTVAVVGISNKPDRPSYGVAKYLSRYFTVIPVNPGLTEWEGLTCYPSLLAIPASIAIDIVDVFRNREAVPAVVTEAIERGGVSLLWMQEGVIHEEAAARARAAGIEVVMDACLAVVHAQVRDRG